MMIVAMYPNTKFERFRAIYKTLDPSCNLVPVTTVKAAYSTSFDYLILGGGVDVDPMFYGQERIHKTQRPDSGRDLIEWILARRAITEDTPTLGVCRGFQMLAIAHGGSLYQDVSLVIPDSKIDHRASNHKIVKVSPILNRRIHTNIVNSRHHQTIRVAPQGFEIVAKSNDGLTEALWRPGFLGVQWHPEDLYFERGSDWQDFFQWHITGFQA